MSTPSRDARALPDRPNLRHLKDQARDLLRAGGAATLAKAQFEIARSYGFSSWPRLKAHIESLQETGQLKEAIDREDLPRVIALMTRNPSLHRAPLGYAKNGPLTWVAECRGVQGPPSPNRLEIARWMIENGSDVHQGGDGPLMRAALQDSRIPMLELLLERGADVRALWNGNYPIVCAPCEALAPQALRWLIAHGADPRQGSEKYGTPLNMLIATYARRPVAKHECLEVLVNHGVPVPDTPAMAFHRGRIDLLEVHLERDSELLHRPFSAAEIFPPEMGIRAGEGLHATPVAGATLLHLAMEYDEMEIARWLLDRGAGVDVRAAVDAEGFGGHTPLFHTVVSLGRRDAAKARLLLESGADPNSRATLRKQLQDMGEPELEKRVEFRNVTPSGYARRFQVPAWVSQPALELLRRAGGVE